ncbi:AAA family ATPase [bacterium]|nr:AAA family ATPase [bacterium]
MIERDTTNLVIGALARQAAVGLIGPRQVGKTTLALALAVAAGRPSVYLDLESPADRDRLSAPELYLKAQAEKLVVLDEIHHAPEIFGVLRGLIDEGRRSGRGTGRFLVLGSASIDLLRQSGESLAGRIEYVEMGPLSVHEAAHTGAEIERLWLRGGFPESFLAGTDADSLRWRRNFVRTYLERDVPQFGPRIPAVTLERLWTMLAHQQGAMLNAAQLAAGLSVSSPTVSAYVDLLADLLLVRRLPPCLANVGKRLVKSPKVYVRDSGLVHALLRIETWDDLMGHPVAGPSWEGFVIENILAAAPEGAQASFYRTSAGAEIDLVLDLGGRRGRWAVEIKKSLTAKPTRGFWNAVEDLRPERAFVVHSGSERYPLAPKVEAISLAELAHELAAMVAK